LFVDSIFSASKQASQSLAAASPPVKFDGGRAYEHIRQVVAFGPRPAGSAALESTLLLYMDEERAMEEIPTLKMLRADLSQLRRRAKRLMRRVSKQVAMKKFAEALLTDPRTQKRPHILALGPALNETTICFFR
jgi:hypothetical protein